MSILLSASGISYRLATNNRAYVEFSDNQLRPCNTFEKLISNPSAFIDTFLNCFTTAFNVVASPQPISSIVQLEAT